MVENYGHISRCNNIHSLEKIFNDNRANKKEKYDDCTISCIYVVLSLVKRMNGTVDLKVNERARTRMINRKKSKRL